MYCDIGSVRKIKQTRSSCAKLGLALVFVSILLFCTGFLALSVPAAEIELEDRAEPTHYPAETISEESSDTLSSLTAPVLAEDLGIVKEFSALEDPFLFTEEIEEGIALADAQIFEEGLTTYADITPLLEPIPSEARTRAVGSESQLNSAVDAANRGEIDYIYFVRDISSDGINNIDQAGLLNGGQGLTIDGRGNFLNHSSNSNGSSLFRVRGGGSARALTIKNLDINTGGGTGSGDNASTIAFATRSGADSVSTAADSIHWTVNLHNVRSTNANQEPVIVHRGLIALSDGVVNFSGDNFWHLGQRRTLINARQVNFDGGSTTLLLDRGGNRVINGMNVGGVSARDARRMNVIRSSPSNNTARELGVGVTLTNGAHVTINRNVTDSSGSGRMGYAVLIDSGSLATAASTARPATLYLSGGSSLSVIGNSRGNGNISDENNGIVAVKGGSGGVSLSEGSELLVHNTRRGTGSDAGTSALFQQIRGGVFTMDGEGTKATFITESAQANRQATVRFFMRGGESNQTLSVTDGAELSIERRHSGSDSSVAALRFGQGTGNGFYVNNGIVNIVNEGNGSNLNPGTSDRNGFNAGVEFADNSWFFRIHNDSDMQVRANRGAAINARGYSRGEISVTAGANFTAMGRTAGAGDNDAIIRATGGNVHFSMDQPQLYDFVNMRPGGGRVFALGSAAGNTFISTASDVSVWRRGVNVWNGDPDRHWTLIDVRLTGAHLRTIDTNMSSPEFVDYYNTSPNSRRMENFTRISGNNSFPMINEALDLTNADRHVRALAEVPQGRIRESRPAWTNEIWADVLHTCGQTETTQIISSNDAPLGTLVRSHYNESLYEVERNAKNIQGSLKMTHDDARFLRAGDTYQIDDAWRSSEANLSRRHQASNVPPSFDLGTVRDVMPPMPVLINSMVVPIHETEFGGTWSLEDEFDDGPLIGSEGIKLHALGDTGSRREIAGSGFVSDDNSWSFTARPGQLFAGDFVWVSLADRQDPPNWNPLQPSPMRDRMIPEASWFIVSPDDVLPVIVQTFYEGIEYMPYRLVSNQLTAPGPDQERTVVIGTGTSTEDRVYTPSRDRQGYIVDRIELRGLGGSVTEIEIGPDGRPLAPIQVSLERSTIHVHYVLDPDYRRNLSVEFRFADFGRTGANSWTLEVPVPYTRVRTGTYNQTGIDRFASREIGDFHITETLTHSDVQSLIDALFEDFYDPESGETIPAVLGELPRGFVPCPTEHIELPARGPGNNTPQLEFPVTMSDLDASRVSASADAERRPIVINYVATLETVTLTQEVERCPELHTIQGANSARLEMFDNMSFNYQIALSRGPVGGRISDTDESTEEWRNHRLLVTIESERAEPDEDTGVLPAWARYVTHTWHGGGAGNVNGAIRIGTWNNTTGGSGGAGLSDSGAGTGTPPNAAASRNRRIGIDDMVRIENVPSTAYIAVTQQISGAEAGSSSSPGNRDVEWLNEVIHNHHERDFTDSYTDRQYLWPPSLTHTPSNASHNTNHANVLSTDTNPSYIPGRPMGNDGRDFGFRVIPKKTFELRIVNSLSGTGVDAHRARSFSIQIRDENNNYLPVGDRLMLWLGDHEPELVSTDSEGNESYEMVRVLTPVSVGQNGIISEGLQPLLPGESFTLMRLGGMHQVRVIMLEFPGHESYDVVHRYTRESENIESEELPGMTTEMISLNRNHLEIVFNSYKDEPPPPAGLMIRSSSLLALGLVPIAALMILLSVRKRKELERFCLKTINTP
ncbi:MAG: hypothetical protein FWC86_02255 [Coriobacteriia bacterium]|nr:hypothetical protein [Coriobacteriia bacterium]